MSETTYKVLVVDDEPNNLTLATVHIRSLGYEVITAVDGPQCLNLVEETSPDVILLDVMMPGLDGFEVCRRLKRHKEHRHIPVVLLTALYDTDDRVTGIEAGADDFITKPFNRVELLARLKSLVRVKRLEEAERSHLRRTLERYVDSGVAQHLLDNPELVAPWGRLQDASVLFADVRGFTGWSEGRAPEIVVQVINAFLSQAVEIVFKHGGAVDKFTGDGLMAHFGALIPEPGHPRRSVAAALEIVASSGSLSHPAMTEPLRVGCGVNSGEVVVGNLGSSRRLDFTVIGDVVNVASHLTGAAEGGQVLVSKATFRRLGQAEVEDLGPRPLKTRQVPVHVFAVKSLGA